MTTYAQKARLAKSTASDDTVRLRTISPGDNNRLYMMKYTATFFLYLDRETEFMRSVDLCHDKKCFTRAYTVNFSTDSTVNEDYFNNLIERSKHIPSPCRIAAIEFCNNLFYDSEFTEISDGERSIFLLEFERCPHVS